MPKSDLKLSLGRPAPASSGSTQALPDARPGLFAGERDGATSALGTRVAQLEAENARLREAVAARDAFLAVAAHELRNPMTPIVGRVQRLRRLMRKPDFQLETLEKGLEQIEWLIGRYVRRATTLLDVSRITAGKFRLDLASTDIGALVREVAEAFGPIVEHADTSLTVSLPEGDLIRVADRLALEQILDNLISNALKYGAGQPIAVSASETDGGELVLEVRDCGPGISPENQARIFERFERAVQAGEQSSGFGVGLWIVRQLSEAMGGKVTVTSRPGEGSAFAVFLPPQTIEGR